MPFSPLRVPRGLSDVCWRGAVPLKPPEAWVKPQATTWTGAPEPPSGRCPPHTVLDPNHAVRPLPFPTSHEGERNTSPRSSAGLSPPHFPVGVGASGF